MEGKWTRDGSRLAFQSAEGRLERRTAREIWAAEFRKIPASGSRSRAPSADLPELTFSTIPALPVLRIRGTSSSGIYPWLGVKFDNELLDPDAAETGLIDDQIIHRDQWIPVDTENLESALARLEAMGIRPGKAMTLGQLVHLKCVADPELEVVDESHATPASLPAAVADTPVPGLAAQLYPYQATGIAFLKLIAEQDAGCILADEMGLGKTLQIIGLLQLEVNALRHPNLVIAPATLIENWRREIALFAPHLTVHVHAGAARAGTGERIRPFDVVITSYDTALRDEHLLSSVNWNVLALDEAQNIKNPAAARTQAVKRLPRRVSIAVTGTPVENRLSDLWSLADFALPGLLGDLGRFEREFGNSTGDAARLAPVVAPVLLRRRVSEVARDLPPRIDVPQPVPMTRDMAEAYEQIRLDTAKEYPTGAALVALQKLRMYCTHPAIVTSWEGSLETMPKYQRLLEILDEVFSRGEKALVFTTYNEMADLLLKDLPRKFPGAHVDCINGTVPVPLRMAVVDSFAAHQGSAALVLNPKAAGVGLNITAANHVIHYNPEWNPAVEDQASARAYRRKQTLPVTVHHLYLADSMEEVMIDRLSFKRDIAQKAVVGHKGDATAADFARALAVSPLARAGQLE